MKACTKDRLATTLHLASGSRNQGLRLKPSPYGGKSSTPVLYADENMAKYQFMLNCLC